LYVDDVLSSTLNIAVPVNNAYTWGHIIEKTFGAASAQYLILDQMITYISDPNTIRRC